MKCFFLKGRPIPRLLACDVPSALLFFGRFSVVTPPLLASVESSPACSIPLIKPYVRPFFFSLSLTPACFFPDAFKRFFPLLRVEFVIGTVPYLLPFFFPPFPFA